MEPVACPGCLAHLARIAGLERRLAALAARLGTNSTNPSVAPSANPLVAPRPVSGKESERRRGGQPGHPPHLKRLLPPDRVNEVVAPGPRSATTAEAEPTRFQAIEVRPPFSAVTEHRRLACACPACGG